MESVNFVFLGEAEMAATLGKKGTSTDLTLYDRKESGVIRTWVVPTGFPDKIQPLLQAVNLAEHAVLHVGSLDRFAGEQILALEVAGISSGLLCHSQMVDHQKVLRAVRGTIAENYRFVEWEDIRREIGSIRTPPMGDGTRVAVDHAFDVKGAGTIILGRVISGAVSRHDQLRICPSGIQIVVKSIQMHDDPVDTAIAPARVGLAIKGARPEDINRGDILCPLQDTLPERDTVSLDFAKTPWYKGEPAVNQMCLVSVGLQVVAGKFSSTEPLTVSLGRPIVCEPGQMAAILKPDSPGVRIMGSGPLIQP